MKIVISGASGFLGSALVSFLKKKGDQPITLVRRPVKDFENEIFWDPEREILDKAQLKEIDAFINLSGENLANGRWTKSKKEKILNSRVTSTRFLSKVIAELQPPPKVFISASAIGYYGDCKEEVLTEASQKGEGFLAEVCEKWEKATQPIIEKNKTRQSSQIRLALLRSGIVLSPHQGALSKMIVPFKCCLGGPIGSGKQYMSWIAIQDWLSIIYFILTNPNIDGPVNAVAPIPVTNKHFSSVLSEVLNRPQFFGMPEWTVKLLFGEMGQEMLLKGNRVVPEKLLKAGFEFQFPELKFSLETLLK